MLYVITEDSNSGRDFWKAVFNTFLDNTDFEIIDFNTTTSANGKIVSITGNMALDDLVNKALMKAKKDDSLFVAFDAIGTSSHINKKTGKKEYFDSGDFINNTHQKCSIKGVNFYVTSYYCFEEIYLSYIELENLVDVDSNMQQLVGVLKYVRNCINNNTEYYDRKRQEVQCVISIKPDAQKNKEHFADALLFQATYAIKTGRFTISKKEEKPLLCWLLDCTHLQGVKNKKYPSKYDCDNCKFKMKNCNTLEKLIDLDNNSLTSNATVTLTGIKNRFTVEI